MPENPMGSNEPKARVPREAVRSTKTTLNKQLEKLVKEAVRAVPAIPQ
jgi:hypothetical protein